MAEKVHVNNKIMLPAKTNKVFDLDLPVEATALPALELSHVFPLLILCFLLIKFNET